MKEWIKSVVPITFWDRKECPHCGQTSEFNLRMDSFRCFAFNDEGEIDYLEDNYDQHLHLFCSKCGLEITEDDYE